MALNDLTDHEKRVQAANRVLYPDFYSLVRVNEKKKVRCPRCGKVHKTDADRYCGTCKYTARNVGVAGTWFVEGM